MVVAWDAVGLPSRVVWRCTSSVEKTGGVLYENSYKILQNVCVCSTAEIATLIGHADQGQTAKEHYIGVPEHRPALQVLDGGE